MDESVAILSPSETTAEVARQKPIAQAVFEGSGSCPVAVPQLVDTVAGHGIPQHSVEEVVRFMDYLSLS